MDGNRPHKNSLSTGKIAQKNKQKRWYSVPEFVDNAMLHGEIHKNFDVFYEK